MMIVKTSFVISVLTICALALLLMFAKRSVRPAVHGAGHVTVLAFLVLCVGQIYAAFAMLGILTAALARRREQAAGLALFLIITLPRIAITVMVGSLQLTTMSSTACVGLGLLAASLFWQGSSRPGRLIDDLPVYMLVLVVIFIGARDTSATNVLRVVSEATITMLLPYLLIRNALRDPAGVRNAVLMVTAAGLAVASIAIFESVKAWPMYNAYGFHFGTIGNTMAKMRGGMLRAGGPFMNPPMSSSIMALCFVVAFAGRDIFTTKSGYRVVLVVLALGLFAMQSRVGWLGAVCGTVGVVFSRKGLRALSGYIPVLLVLIAGVYGAAMASPRVADLVGFSADAKGSSEYRDNFSKLGLEIVRAHPLIGQPQPIVELQMSSMRQGEGIIDFVNGYLSVALFAGVIGLALFAGALLLQGWNAYRGRQAALQRGAGSFADMGLGVTMAAGSMFGFIPTDQRIIATMLVLFALCNAARRCAVPLLVTTRPEPTAGSRLRPAIG